MLPLRLPCDSVDFRFMFIACTTDQCTVFRLIAVWCVTVLLTYRPHTAAAAVLAETEPNIQQQQQQQQTRKPPVVSVSVTQPRKLDPERRKQLNKRYALVTDVHIHTCIIV